MHCALSVDPARLAGVALEQLVHAAAELFSALKVPAAQGTTALPWPVYPASALQSFRAVEPVALVLEPTGQTVQAVSWLLPILY